MDLTLLIVDSLERLEAYVHRHVRFLLITAGVFPLLIPSPPASAAPLSIVDSPSMSSGAEHDTIPLERRKKKKKKKKKYKLESRQYRYDWADRHLGFGLNLGGSWARGNTLNAFPFGGSVTPYFRGAFGDGNSLELNVTVGLLARSGNNAEWLFFRSPLLSGSAVGGQIFFIAPNLQFRYEVELGASIKGRTRYFFWGGMGVGTFITNGEATLYYPEGSGLEDHTVTNQEVFLDFVPTVGVKFRFLDFTYLEVGTRVHTLLPLASKLTDEEEWTKGKPPLIQEFYIGTANGIEGFMGISYEFY